jgi:23S rRNA-intervening sequence protein
MFGFEKLDVWQKAVEYAGTIYHVTRTFPTEERLGSRTNYADPPFPFLQTSPRHHPDRLQRILVVSWKLPTDRCWGHCRNSRSPQKQQFLGALVYERSMAMQNS